MGIRLKRSLSRALGPSGIMLSPQNDIPKNSILEVSCENKCNHMGKMPSPNYGIIFSGEAIYNYWQRNFHKFGEVSH